FRPGEPEAPLAVVGDAGVDDQGRERRGTQVSFLPSPQTFTQTEFAFARLEHRFRELAFLSSGVRIYITDDRHSEPKTVELHYEGGIQAFVKYIDRAKQALLPNPIAIRRSEERRVGKEWRTRW